MLTLTGAVISRGKHDADRITAGLRRARRGRAPARPDPPLSAPRPGSRLTLPGPLPLGWAAMTTSQPTLIVQLRRDGAVDRNFRADPPPSLATGQVVLDHVIGAADGDLELPEVGEIVLSVLSPEALTRERQRVRDVVRDAPVTDQPLMIIVEAAEELREDELAAVLDAAQRADRLVILRLMADA